VRRKRIFIVLAVCVLVGIGVVVFWPGEREPEYNGKKLSEWLIYWGKAQSDQQVWEVENAVRHIGTNSLPYLIKWMSYEPPAWKEKMLHWKIVNVMPDFLLHRIFKEEIQSQWVLNALIILALEYNQVGDELIRMIDRNSRWERAIGALSSLGTNGLVALNKVATNHARAAEVRFEAMREIGFMINRSRYRGQADIYEKLALPDLIRSLDEQEIAYGAAQALGVARVAPELVVPALTNAMRFSDSSSRVFVTDALGHFREKARGAVPVIIPLLNDSDDRVRVAATNAVLRIAPEVLTNGVKDF